MGETMIITSETTAKCPIQPGSLCMFDTQCNQTAGCKSWKCSVPGSEGRHFCGPPKDAAVAQLQSDSGMWSVDLRVNSTGISRTVNVTTTHRTTDPGWGVDLKFKGNRGVHADIWNTDGDAFFKIAVGDAHCSVDVGSDGEEPGAVVSVFESHGLACSFKQEKGKGTHYNVVINAELSHAHDCSGTPTQPGKGPKCPSETRLAPDAETALTADVTNKTKCALKCAAEAVGVFGACAATCLTNPDKAKCIDTRCGAAQLAFEVACTIKCGHDVIITSEAAAKCPIQPGSLCMFDTQCNQTAGCESWKCSVPGSEG